MAILVGRKCWWWWWCMWCDWWTRATNRLLKSSERRHITPVSIQMLLISKWLVSNRYVFCVCVCFYFSTILSKFNSKENQITLIQFNTRLLTTHQTYTPNFETMRFHRQHNGKCAHIGSIVWYEVRMIWFNKVNCGSHPL